ncbi:hypothetical protein U4960_06615 [Altererythrobacter sp. H2]|uniref:hypothetical protein n=1 Tax=Altererythrobacter sp. H2 TaxID=3108391 RepID=UPI002B4BCBC7|nr:hypothetical protein [Altererythrobacter sp. H2]WRK96984.1 hypothetical protein U4960_06615 [Altererythrobacter sp. H2]
MRYPTLFVISGLVALFAVPAAAQDHHGSDPAAHGSAPASEAPHNSAHETDEADMAGRPAERKAEFAAWPQPIRDYFQTLPENRRALFWGLPDSDKQALSMMAEPERAAAWQQVEQRFAAQNEQAAPVEDPQS